MEDTIYYIYKITNIINEKIYIGQAKNPAKRWHNHLYSARSSKPVKLVIHIAMAKYGIDNFKFEVIACCKGLVAANNSEYEIINKYNSRDNKIVYNIAPGGNGRGECHQQTRDKISASKIGKISKLRKKFSKEELELIINDSRCNEALSRDLNISSRVIKRTRIENNAERCQIPNKIIFTDEQVASIFSDARQSRIIAEEFGVSKFVILKLRKENNVDMKKLYLEKYGRTSFPRSEKQKHPAAKSQESIEKFKKTMTGRQSWRKTILTEEQTNIILTDPRSARQLSKDMKLCIQAINSLRKERKIILPRPAPLHKKSFSNEELKMILSKEKPITVMAKELHVSPNTINRVINEYKKQYTSPPTNQIRTIDIIENEELITNV